LISLGEVVLTSATAIAETPTQPLTLLAGVEAFLLVAALWAFYFAGSPVIVDREEAPAADPIWTARMGANSQYVVLIGLVMTAVGCETVIAHPRGEGSFTVGLLLGSGPLLYVATQTWYLWITARRSLTTRWIACLLLTAVIPAAAALPVLATLGIVAVLLAVISLAAPRLLPRGAQQHLIRRQTQMGRGRAAATAAARRADHLLHRRRGVAKPPSGQRVIHPQPPGPRGPRAARLVGACRLTEQPPARARNGDRLDDAAARQRVPAVVVDDLGYRLPHLVSVCCVADEATQVRWREYHAWVRVDDRGDDGDRLA
jgi:hypothetical protein